MTSTDGRNPWSPDEVNNLAVNQSFPSPWGTLELLHQAWQREMDIMRVRSTHPAG